MLTAPDHRLMAHLATFVSESKKELMERVLGQRTRYLTLVLEDIFQPHNASAVIRSCDCFGVQDLHVIENRNAYMLNPNVTQGSSKWINLWRYNEEGVSNTSNCFQHLKDQGYQLYATSPHAEGLGLSDVPVDQKIALIFGTELEGLSSEAMAAADAFVKIPMYGFTESFNISVCAALCLHTLMNKLRESNAPWQLTTDEQDAIRLEWYRRSVRNSDILEKEFMKKS